MTNAKINDRKASTALPIITDATCVFDRAHNDYGWYYEQMHLNGNRFVGRMKVNAQYEVMANHAVQGTILEDQTI